ncbi:MAG TPA: TIGR03557 family F420-dependent LLM class oxidoreductase [Dehalococcoidia bacterium]
MLELGYKAATEQIQPRDLLEYAVQAEAAGFDSVWASDHFHPWMDRGASTFVWTWLGALGERTERLRLGTEVTCPTLRYHPALVAQAAATLGAMYPGRAFLSVGSGESLNETPLTGLWPAYAERRDRLAEAVDLIRRLWTGRSVTFHGEFYDTYSAKLYTVPETPPPIYLAADGPRSARLAGRAADGLITTSTTPQQYEPVLGAFREAAQAAGRDPEALPRCVEIKVMLGTPEEAVPVVRQWWGSSLFPIMFNREIYDPTEAETLGQMVGVEAVARKVFISPDPDAHVAYLEPFLQAGFTTLILFCPDPDQRPFLEAYGRHVLPRLREAAQRAGARP